MTSSGFSGSRMVSIVDDDAFAREGISCLVQACGYNVAAFTSAEHFLASGHLQDTTCVVTDLNMPGLSGLELQRELRNRGCRIPIIFVTAYPNEQQMRRALDAGAVGFLSKPFSEQSLLDCLALALDDSATGANKDGPE